MERRELHEGKWLKGEIADAGFSQSAFARRAKVALPTLKVWFGQPQLRMREDMFARVAQTLGHTPHSFRQKLQFERVNAKLEDPELVHSWRDNIAKLRALEEEAEAQGRSISVADMLAVGLPVGEGDEFDPNVEPFSESKVPGEIPVFNLSVAAGTWVDVDETGEVCDPRQIDHGLFRIKIRGDSMLPRFANGAVVEFRCLRDGRDALEVGACYYVQRDSQATFKQLAQIGEDTLVFRATNRKKYPKPLPADRRSIVRMARAVGIYTEL